MKTYQLLVFLTVVLLVYTLVNLYVFNRGLQSFTGNSPTKTVYKILFLVLVSSYILARIFERVYPSVMSDVLMWIGSFWLAAMMYFFLIVFILDLFRVFNHFLPYYPGFIIGNYAMTKQYLFYGSVAVVTLLMIGGYINASNPRIKSLNVNVPKKIIGISQLNIVAVSDIHLGTIICNNKFEKIVNKINSLHPDIILLAGDVIDENVDAVVRQNTGESLKKLQSKYGTYAVTGNHEYIGGVEKAVKYLTAHNITMLRDTAILIDNSFYIIGREDKEKSRYSGFRRKTLDEIIKDIDVSLPLILMDHQPFGLKEACSNGIDLQISGHTHHGQMFPINLITKKIYEISRGYKKIENTFFYVSSGVGTWGPPVRIGTQPEIVNIIVEFD
jgi:predicted MPP superfamily phosphohydrolase